MRIYSFSLSPSYDKSFKIDWKKRKRRTIGTVYAFSHDSIIFPIYVYWCIFSFLEKTSRLITINATLHHFSNTVRTSSIPKRYKKLSIVFFLLRTIDKYTSRGLLMKVRFAFRDSEGVQMSQELFAVKVSMLPRLCETCALQSVPRLTSILVKVINLLLFRTQQIVKIKKVGDTYNLCQ